MAKREIHKQDIGTAFDITLYDGKEIVDVSNASTMSIIFVKPSKAKVIKTAVHKTDGLDGIIRYITIADDLDLIGKWQIQAKVTLATGTWSSDITSFRVHDNL